MVRIILFLLALLFIVFIHELGHYMFARLFNVRVEKFYMLFNIKMSLVRLKKFDGKWHVKFFAKNDDEEWDKHPESTEWGLGWLPLGGYCAISGMVDETHTSEDLAAEPQEWEYRSKPAWQRFFIIIGGILMNFIGAIVIFIMLMWHNGTDKLPLRNMSYGLYYSQILVDEGFAQQDRILSIDGVEPDVLGDVVQAILVEGKRNVVVLRGTDTVALTMSEDLSPRIMALHNSYDRTERAKKHADNTYQKQRLVLIEPWIPSVIDTVHQGFAAYEAGMKAGDSIVAVGGVPTPCYTLLTQELQHHPCDSVVIDFYRQGEPMSAQVFLGDECKLGVQAQLPYQYEHTTYTFFQAIPAGIQNGWETLVSYVKSMRLVFTKEGAQQVGGFIAIGSIFPAAWNWSAFWAVTAFLNIILAFMNFLPIPALDGGYILFILVEMISGRKPSDKFLEKANNVGWWILIGLLILANGNDIIRLFF